MNKNSKLQKNFKHQKLNIMLELVEYIVNASRQLTTLRGDARAPMPEGWAWLLWKEGKNL